MSDNANQLKDSLSDLWFNIKHFLQSLWDSLTGFFLFASKMRQQERRRQKMDTKRHFREEDKKRMMKWVLKERKEIKKLYKHPAIPKGQEDNQVIYNYLQSVILSVNPQKTLEQMVGDFYATLHPYLHIYYYAWKDLCKILTAKNKEQYISSRCKDFEKKYIKVPDLKENAIYVMKIKKATVQRIREEEAEYRRKKKREASAVDGDLNQLKIDKEIIQKRIDSDKAMLEAMMEKEKQERSRLASH